MQSPAPSRMLNSRAPNPSLAGGQRAAPSAFPALYSRDPGWQAQIGQPCFSPHTNHGERFLGPNLDLCCRRWHPAKTRGCSVSPALSCISFRRPPSRLTIRHSSSPRDRAEGSAGTFQRGKFPAPHFTGNAFLKSPTAGSRTLQPELTAHSKPGLTRGT
jgi:hypothetical protein